MKRLTRDDAIQECAVARRELDLALRAVRALADGAIDATERTPLRGGCRYRYQLFDSGSPIGGVVLETYLCSEQAPLYTLAPLDGLLDTWRRRAALGGLDTESLEQWTALEKLRGARDRKLASAA